MPIAIQQNMVNVIVGLSIMRHPSTSYIVTFIDVQIPYSQQNVKLTINTEYFSLIILEGKTVFSSKIMTMTEMLIQTVTREDFIALFLILKTHNS
jgi:hypothetical protein